MQRLASELSAVHGHRWRSLSIVDSAADGHAELLASVYLDERQANDSENIEAILETLSTTFERFVGTEIPHRPDRREWLLSVKYGPVSDEKRHDNQICSTRGRRRWRFGSAADIFYSEGHGYRWNRANRLVVSAACVVVDKLSIDARRRIADTTIADIAASLGSDYALQHELLDDARCFLALAISHRTGIASDPQPIVDLLLRGGKAPAKPIEVPNFVAADFSVLGYETSRLVRTLDIDPAFETSYSFG